MPKILLIEDNPGDARLIVELLKGSENLAYKFEIFHVERVAEAVSLLQGKSAIDIILSDITLPDSRGTETLTALAEVASHLPILFMTGTNDEALATVALKKGAQDYLVKGRFNGETLARTLEFAIGRKQFQNEMQEVRAREQENQRQITTLAHEKKQLIKLNQSKDEFVALASHQLRTPATVVKQYLGMVVEGYAGDVAEVQMEILQAAYDSNERQLNVINELLKTAQLDMDDVTIDARDHNLTQLVREAIAGLSVYFELHSQTVLLDAAGDYVVRLDAAEIKLALENLLENAGKYTPDHKQIRVAVRPRGAFVLVQVADEGVGIDKKFHTKIFDKFTRVNNELSDTVSGTGLGLYWVKRIMQLHGGKVSLKSEPGRGSTFTLSFPR